MRRVVVTGMGGITALGTDWPTIRAAFAAGRTAICRMESWERFSGLNTRLAAPVEGFLLPEHWPRKKTRTMGRVAQLAVAASEQALTVAGLLEDPVLRSGRTGAAYGSSFGSPDAVLGFYELKLHGQSKALNATTYIRMMGHTTLVNLGLFFGLTGRLIPTSNACVSGSQAIGFAAETIRLGAADVMLAGGAEELDVTDAAVFDTLFATSTRNDSPTLTPRPFDRDRDGLVIGEGAATLVLEEYEHARARGATIFAELVGFATNADGNHVTQPQPETMSRAISLALTEAGLPAEAIGFVSGHGTATEGGDIAEAEATRVALGEGIPLHSLKGHFGHSLGACGAIEAWLGIEMLRAGWVCPTANLEAVDPRCAGPDYILGAARRIETEHFLSTNFAFGGVNSALIFRRL